MTHRTFTEKFFSGYKLTVIHSIAPSRSKGTVLLFEVTLKGVAVAVCVMLSQSVYIRRFAREQSPMFFCFRPLAGSTSLPTNSLGA